MFNVFFVWIGEGAKSSDKEREWQSKTKNKNGIKKLVG